MFDAEIYFVDVKRTPCGIARIKERVQAGKCVACECSTSEANPAGKTKHTCEKCRSRHRALMAKLDLRQKARFLANLIKTGRVLIAQEIRSLKRDDATQRMFEDAAG